MTSGGSGSQLGGQQLSDLDGVERGPFSEIVPRNEQRKPTTVRYPGVLADPADEGVIGTRCGKRSRHFDQRDTWCLGEDVAGTLR